MEVGKYYTPDVSEFYIGFECEYLVKGNKWINQKIFRIHDMIYIESLFEPRMGGSSVRVKYLDKEDIESLGFEIIENKHSYFEFKIKKSKGEYDYDIIGTYLYEDHTLTIDNGNQWPDEYDCVVQDIIIKNKSELKKLLTQLGIEYNE